MRGHSEGIWYSRLYSVEGNLREEENLSRRASRPLYIGESGYQEARLIEDIQAVRVDRMRCLEWCLRCPPKDD